MRTPPSACAQIHLCGGGEVGFAPTLLTAVCAAQWESCDTNMANEQRIASHTSHVWYGFGETLFSIKAVCHAGRAAGRHDVHRIRGTTQTTAGRIWKKQWMRGWAQAAPLQLRSVGSRLFTTRGSITTKVLRELCVKILRSAMCFSCWARRRTSSLQHLFRREARGSSLQKKPRQGCQSFANDARNRPSAVWRATRTTM